VRVAGPVLDDRAVRVVEVGHFDVELSGARGAMAVGQRLAGAASVTASVPAVVTVALLVVTLPPLALRPILAALV
jgi:hypothetical protein